MDVSVFLHRVFAWGIVDYGRVTCGSIRERQEGRRMTVDRAVRILTRLQVCVDTDDCDADCEACRYNDDQTEIHKAIEWRLMR